jgi:hypothetical protein
VAATGPEQPREGIAELPPWSTDTIPTMAGPGDFDEVFLRLRAILAGHAPPLVVNADSRLEYSLDLPGEDLPPPRRFVGGVRQGKRYVSFHLIPVYAFPDLLEPISPALRRRMQGKSCFNFGAVDGALFKELGGVTSRAVDRYMRDGVALHGVNRKRTPAVTNGADAVDRQIR